MKSYHLILSIIFILFISSSAVYAESNDTDICQEASHVGNFNDLYSEIENAENDSTIYLQMDYSLNSESQGEEIVFKEGININKVITIDGDNHIIDAKNLVRIFNVNSDVVIRNIVLINGYHTGSHNGAGAINVETGSLNLENSILINNNAYSITATKGTALTDGGGAICANQNTYVRIDNCSFINNTISASCNVGGGAIMFKAGSSFIVENSLFMNNAVFSYGGTYGGAIAYRNNNHAEINFNSFINNSAGFGPSISSSIASIMGNLFINSGIDFDFGAQGSSTYNSFINSDMSYSNSASANIVVEYNWFGINPSVENRDVVASLINNGGTLYVTLTSDGRGNSVPHPDFLYPKEVKFVGDVKYDKLTTEDAVAINKINAVLKEGYIYNVNVTVDRQILDLYFKYVNKHPSINMTISPVNESYSSIPSGEFKIKGSNTVYHSFYEAITDALLMDDNITIYVGEGVFTEKWSDTYYNYEYTNYNFDITSNNKLITIIGAGNDKSIFKGETSGFKINGNSSFRFVNITFMDFTDNIFTFNATNSNNYFTNCKFKNISTEYVIYLSGENSKLFFDGCYFDKVNKYPFWNNADNSYIIIDSTIFDRTNCDYALSEIYMLNDYVNHISTIYHNFNDYYIFNHNFLLSGVSEGFDCTPNVYLSNETIYLGDSVDIVADFNYFTNSSGTYMYDSNFIDDFAVSFNTAAGSNKINLNNGVAIFRYVPTSAGTQTIIVKYGSKITQLTLNIISRQKPSFNVEGNENIVVSLPSDATGNVTFIVNGNKTDKEVVNGYASINLAPLKDMKYVVEVIYPGDLKYTPISKTIVFSPYRNMTYLNIECNDTPIYGDAIINVHTNADGKVKLIIDNVQYTSNINNGIATFSIKNLTLGNHEIMTIYGGNSNYLPESNVTLINIIKNVPTLSSYVKTVLSGEDVIMNITFNEDISSEVYIFMDNKVYRTDVVNGTGYLNFTRLHGGNYNYRLYFNGNGKYYPSEINNAFSVNKLRIIYVDSVNGNDENMGLSNEDALKSLGCALECIRYGGTIYLEDGIYSGIENTRLTFNQPVNLIGCGNVIFDGENNNYFSKINEGLNVNFKNIDFRNFVSYIFNISKITHVNIVNSTVTGGSAIVFINEGVLNITDSNFKNINSAGIILNRANLYLNNSTFDSITSNSVKGSAISNYGTAIVMDSTFKNSNIYGGDCVWGLVYNEKSMSIKGCVFDSNVAIFYQYPVGTALIYNNGVLNASYNVFINTKEFTIDEVEEDMDHRYVDFYNVLGKTAYIDYNWWDYNESPYNLHLTNVKPDLWFVTKCSIDEYVALDIGDDINVNVSLILNEVNSFNPNELPLKEVSFDDIVKELHDGFASFNFNKTSVKGSYDVTLKVGGFETSYLIDVGKNYSYMDVYKKDIDYGDTLQIRINVSSDTSLLSGKVTVFINNQIYNLNLVNGYASLKIEKLLPGDYDLKVVYEGDEDFFKNYYYGKVSVLKQKTQISIDLEDIMVGQKGVAHVSIDPNTLVNARGYIYIDGVRRNIYFYQGKATYEFKKFDIGQYNITVEFLGNTYYDSSSVSTIFKVNKYKVNLSLSIDDVYVGQRAYLYILKDPSDLSGDVHFIVEGTTQRDDYAYLSPEQSETRITLKNLGGGSYNITVFYGGDSKYEPCNASVSFTVLKYTPDFNVTMIYNDTVAHIDFNLTTNKYSAPIGGVIEFWHNDNVTYINVTDGFASYDFNLTEGYNYLFAYYKGDANYNYTLWNSTVVINVPFILTGDDVVMNVGENNGYRVYLMNPYGKALVNQSVIFNFMDELYQGYTDVNGSIFFTMYYLDAGIYNITASYNETTINNTVTVLKVSDYQMNVDYIENVIGDEIIFTVTLPDDATGNVTINNKTANINAGQVKLTLSNLEKGNQTFYINYSGDRKYENKFDNLTINVGDDKKTILEAPNVEMYYHDGTRFVVSLRDRNNNPITMQVVTININNVNYDVITDNDGKASIRLNLQSGSYDVIVSYESEIYTNSYVNSSVIIKPTAIGWDLVKVYRNASKYVVRFTDFNGNLLTVGEATFNINGVLYKRNINSEGLASLAINLNPGTYVITAINPVTGESISNTITVLSCIVENHDLTKYYKNASQYTVRAIDSQGNPVGAGEYVLFNINGVFYVRQTDANGYVTLSINLDPGEYIITAEYNFCKVSNNIKVLPILSAYNLVKKYGTSNPFRAFLLDGKGRPLEGATVIFNINGILYERVTDIDGVAKLNINLMQGRYIITSTYNGACVSNTITIA